MADIELLKRLAEAATPGPWRAIDYGSYDGSEECWYVETSAGPADIFDGRDGTVEPNHWNPARGKADMQFIAAANPAAVLALIAENEQLSLFERAWDEWHQKTEWVQQTAEPKELGMHRADVLRKRIDQLRAELERARADAERYRHVRRLDPNQFGELWQRNIQTGEPFDGLVDAAMGNGGKTDG